MKTDSLKAGMIVKLTGGTRAKVVKVSPNGVTVCLDLKKGVWGDPVYLRCDAGRVWDVEEDELWGGV